MGYDKFLIKRASFLGFTSEDVRPLLAPAVGGLAGRVAMNELIGGTYGKDIGAALGAIAGGAYNARASRIEKEEAAAEAARRAQQDMFSNAVEGMPKWAFDLLSTLPDTAKHASSGGGVWDVPLSEVPGLPVAQSWYNKGPAAAAKMFGGMSLGGGAGALAGLGVGKGIEYLAGRPINVPGVNISVSDLLSGLGGVIGVTKAMRYVDANT